ncbi:MAG: hypothetical protein FWD65_00820 [Coriobacteriia bacterium]|nr:hypothetical protein [Coriobacteriia bacterium]
MLGDNSKLNRNEDSYSSSARSRGFRAYLRYLFLSDSQTDDNEADSKKGVIRNRWKIFVYVAIVLSIASYFVIYKVDEFQQSKLDNAVSNMWVVKDIYAQQNHALWGLGYCNRYQPYTSALEVSLQIHLNAYHLDTNKVVTRQDVKTFLQESSNSNGTPRTYEDDTTGHVKDYVDWFKHNSITVDSHEENLQKMLPPGFKLYEGLSLSQLAELEKALQDPHYMPKL